MNQARYNHKPMILTITLNTALDRILFITEWVTGTTMRTSKVVTSVGGKGLDSSVVLRHLGAETTGVCFLAGKTGHDLLALLEGYGIYPEPVWVGGETRIAHVVVETLYHRHSHLMAGQIEIAPEHLDQLFDKVRENLKNASWVICGGSLPANVPANIFSQVTAICHQFGVPILIDTSSQSILECLPNHPDIVKMNWAEFQDCFKIKADTLDELTAQAGKIYREYGLRALVITCGGEGLLAFSPAGVYHAVAPKQVAVNAAGAGDAVSSALTWRLSLGESWPEALRWSAATSAAVVLTEGTADCSRLDVDRIFPDVQVKRLDLLEMN